MMFFIRLYQFFFSFLVIVLMLPSLENGWIMKNYVFFFPNNFFYKKKTNHIIHDAIHYMIRFNPLKGLRYDFNFQNNACTCVYACGEINSFYPHYYLILSYFIIYGTLLLDAWLILGWCWHLFTH